jgi:hypothetical protein
MNEFFAGEVHELMNKLAYEFWEERGRPIGSPGVDWHKAEQKIRLSTSAPPEGPPFSAFSMGPAE